MPEERNKKFVDECMRKVAATGSVLDVGGGEPFGKWMGPYKELFTGVEYRSFDYDTSTGADIVGDIHDMPLANDCVSSIICSSVLEHVEDPARAVRELYRILKPGGVLFLYVPSTYPYHARKGHYPDLWRFFDDTLDVLLSNFSHVEKQKRGGYFMALSFFVPSQHVIRPVLNPLANFLDVLFKTEERSTTAGFYVLASK